MNASRRLFLSAILGLVAIFAAQTFAHAAKYCPCARGMVMNGVYWHMCFTCPGSAPPCTYTIPAIDGWHDCQSVCNAQTPCLDPIEYFYSRDAKKRLGVTSVPTAVKCRGEAPPGDSETAEGRCGKPDHRKFKVEITLDWEVTADSRLFRVFEVQSKDVKTGDVSFSRVGQEADTSDMDDQDRHGRTPPEDQKTGTLVDGGTAGLLLIEDGGTVFQVLEYKPEDEKAAKKAVKKAVEQGSPSDAKSAKGKKPPKKKQ